MTHYPLPCYARLRTKVKHVFCFTTSEVHEKFVYVNKTRFDDLFDIDFNESFEIWTITGKTWLSWITFKIFFTRQRITWEHQTDLIVNEWVIFTFCHKVIRMMDPDAKYRDEGDNFLSEPDFDLRFPTLDLWIRQLNLVSGNPIDQDLVDTQSRTPDCFWINR